MFQPQPPRRRVAATIVAAIALAFGYVAVVVGCAILMIIA